MRRSVPVGRFTGIGGIAGIGGSIGEYSPLRPGTDAVNAFLSGLRVALVGYVLGTLPSARIAARLAASRGSATPEVAVSRVATPRAAVPKLAGLDVTAAGSRNPGAANASALMGKRIGAAVLAADVAKAAAAGVAGRAILGPAGAHVAATAAVVGHCHPVWTGFGKGGKGVACSIGQMLATFPAYTVVDVGLGWVMARSDWWRTRQTEATAAACGLWVALGMLWWRRDLPNLWGGRPTVGLPLSAAVSSAVIIRRFNEADKAKNVEKSRSTGMGASR